MDKEKKLKRLISVRYITVGIFVGILLVIRLSADFTTDTMAYIYFSVIGIIIMIASLLVFTFLCMKIGGYRSEVRMINPNNKEIDDSPIVKMITLTALIFLCIYLTFTTLFAIESSGGVLLPVLFYGSIMFFLIRKYVKLLKK